MSTNSPRHYGLAEIRRAIATSLCALGIAACTSANQAPAATLQPAPPITSSTNTPAGEISSTTGAAPISSHYSPDVEIAKLWQEREHGGTGDFPLGPGDLVNLSCPDDDEFNGQYRISGQGTINLPLVGEVKAAGKTQDELRAELAARLKHYLRNPQINLMIGEYRSRQVGVFGAVAKPGVYNLAGPNDTLQDMISLAGGYSTDASPRLQFKPGQTIPEGTPTAGSAGAADEPIIPPSSTDLKGAIVVDIDKTEGHSFLALPARPGDVINVTAGGQVLVDGWVGKPGSYPITRDLRVLGAVAAAGGALFPAKTESVQIVRKDEQGQQIILVDLEKVRRGDQADIAVQDGDVVEVPVSGAKVIPYGFYQAAMTMIRVGGYVSP
jgi:polysaccharide biosynthesis/export protein